MASPPSLGIASPSTGAATATLPSPSTASVCRLFPVLPPALLTSPFILLVCWESVALISPTPRVVLVPPLLTSSQSTTSTTPVILLRAWRNGLNLFAHQWLDYWRILGWLHLFRRGVVDVRFVTRCTGDSGAAFFDRCISVFAPTTEAVRGGLKFFIVPLAPGLL